MKYLLFTILIFSSFHVLGQSEKLEVEGAIIISDSESNPPITGTMRWSGTDFEGWDGFQWRSLTCCNGNGDTPEFFCVNGTCISGESGLYSTLNECLGFVSPNNATTGNLTIGNVTIPAGFIQYPNGIVITATVFDINLNQFIMPCTFNPALNSFGLFISPGLPSCTSSGAGLYTVTLRFNEPICNPSFILNDYDVSNAERITDIMPNASSVDVLSKSNDIVQPISTFTLNPSPTDIDEILPIGNNNYGWLNFTGNVTTITMDVNKSAGGGIGFYDLIIPNCSNCN